MILLDGKARAAALSQELTGRVAALAARGVVPGLTVVLVGEDPASEVYVRNKERTARKLGLASHVIRLPADTAQAALLARIDELNADAAVHGILVQLPVPRQIDPAAVIEAIDPAKDVDGFHPVNVGLLTAGSPRFVPCTPLGVMDLLRAYQVPLAGRRALVIGRSAIVGKPVALLLLGAHATVTIAHSRTPDLAAEVARADVVVAAVGQPRLVQGPWVKPGAAVVDVGVNRLDDGSLCGDVDFEGVAARAGWLSPVPGGVGPMTIGMLMANTVQAAVAAVEGPAHI